MDLVDVDVFVGLGEDGVMAVFVGLGEDGVMAVFVGLGEDGVMAEGEVLAGVVGTREVDALDGAAEEVDADGDVPKPVTTELCVTRLLVAGLADVLEEVQPAKRAKTAPPTATPSKCLSGAIMGALL